MSGEQDHGSYIREKLRGAKAAIADDGWPMQERLRSAYLYNLFSLQREWFPHADDQDEFDAIRERDQQLRRDCRRCWRRPNHALDDERRGR